METAVYSRLNPFPAPLIENRLLSGPGSEKEVRHFVFDLAGSGLTYRVGQSLGIYPTNNPAIVEAILKAGNFTGNESVTAPKTETPMSLQEALSRHSFLGGPTVKTLEAFHAAATDSKEKETLGRLIDPTAVEAAHAFLSQRFFIDLMEEFPSAKLPAQSLVNLMKKLQPRMYSIASSPKNEGSRIDLTIATVRYNSNSRPRGGVCSTFLADRTPLQNTVPVFVGETPFKLTDDDAAPLIMVGPGTGVASFRAFLQERSARAAKGKNWLFFGDQREKCDFLYRDEILAHRDSGLLTKLDLAWSRDQEQKIYVQDLMHKNAAELWSWLQSGAYFYVCGDAKQMAKDVDAMLHQIVAEQGKMDALQAADFVHELKKSNRYQKDVY